MLAKKNYFFSIFLLSIFVSQIYLKTKINLPKINRTKQETSLNAKVNYLKYLTLGQERFFVTLLWIVTFIESDIERDKTKILDDWIFLRFKAITELDKKFYQAYLWGGMYLGVIKDNPVAAEALYKRGVEVFPSDLELNYKRGLNALFDLKDKKIAFASFSKMQNSSSSKFSTASTMLARLLVEQGSIEEAYDVILKHMQKVKRPKRKKYLFNMLNSLRIKIDLKCLNGQLGNCRYKDLQSRLYKKRGRKYFPPL